MRVLGGVLVVLFGSSYLVSSACQPFRCEGKCVNGLNQSLSYLPGNLCGDPVLSEDVGDLFFLEQGMKLQVRSLDTPSSYEWRIDLADKAGAEMFANAFLKSDATNRIPKGCLRKTMFDGKPIELLEPGCVDELVGSLRIPVERPVDRNQPCSPSDWKEALEHYSSTKSHPLQGDLRGVEMSAWGGLLQPVRALVAIRVRGEERFVPPWMSVRQLEVELGRDVVRIERRATNVALISRTGPGAPLECVEYEPRHDRKLKAPGGERTDCTELFGYKDSIFLDFRPGETGALAISPALKNSMLFAPGDVVVETEGY